MVLKIDNLTALTRQQVQQFMQDGIALVKVPTALITQMKAVEMAAKQFFRQETAVKEKAAFNEEREGYLDQRHKGYYIERYITRGHRQAPDQLKQQFRAMLDIRQFFTIDIMLPLIKAIFQQLGISDYFNEVETNPDYTLSLIYYSPGDFDKERLAPHRDTAIMTALWTQASGYRAKFQGQWQAIMPHDDYVIVQIGKGLSFMTGEHCHAIEHDVNVNETIERFSMASFLALRNEAEFRDYVNNRLLSPTFIEYVKEDIAKAYKQK